MLRDTQSKFLDDLSVSKRGMVKVASSQVPKGKEATTKHEVKKVLKTFEKSPDVSKRTLNQYQQRAELDPNPKNVAKDFFKDLGEARKHKKQMHLVTAMSFRQAGIFKMAGRDVYEDLETGDFWKISEDKKHVMRLFKEDEKGVSDKKASIEKQADDKEYNDSTEFTSELDEVENLVNKINTIVLKPKWVDYLKTTDDTYATDCLKANREFVRGLEAFQVILKEMQEAR